MAPQDKKTKGIFAQYFSLVRTCWRYSRGHRGRMALFYFMFFIANAIFMVQPYVMGELVNTLQEGGDNLLSKTTTWLALYVGTTCGFWVLHGPARVIERDVAFHAVKAFRLELYDMLTRLPLHWHHDNHSGNTINRANKAAEALNRFAELQFVYIQTAVRFFGVFTAMIFIDAWVAGALMVFAIATFWMLAQFDKFIMRLLHEVNEKSHVYSSYLFDFIGNIQNVVMFNLARFTGKRLEGAIDAWHHSFRRMIALVEWKWSLMSVLCAASHFGVLYFYISWHLEPGRTLMLGTLAAIFQYMFRLDGVFVAIAQKYADLVQVHTDLRAVNVISDTFNKIGVRDDHLPALEVKEGHIRFDSVHFSYNPAAKVFSGFHLDIAPRQKIGIIGHSGAGKSTLVSLLLRFYEGEDCRITIDGQELRSISSKSLRDNIAVIPQDTTLFEDTLRENIRFGSLHATEAEILSASKRAHCHEFITRTPMGYDSLVGERGLKLSGGQRQRIAIARAILKAAPILVLDEATSALDTESEKLIQGALAELMEGRTVIAIAHRLSTISHLDRLVVLDKGHIIEDGTHAELLAKGGVYARLWQMQSGGFLPG